MKEFLGTVLNANEYTQKFWAWSHPQQNEKEGVDYYFNSAELIRKMKAEHHSVRFVFHGFFDTSLWPKLMFSSLPKRCIWISWGHDIYRHKAEGRTIKDKGMHLLHRLISRRLFQCYSLNKGDAEVTQNVLWPKSVKVMPYPLIGSNVIPAKKHTTEPYTILVGNSAAPSNEHIDALSWLSGFSDENIKVVVPLNYAGTAEYVKQVNDFGSKLFGDKFEGITRMLDKNEYDSLLASVDVAVFAHQRQQGLYVAYSILKFGKKIFFREKTTSYKSMISSGFRVDKSENISTLTFEQFIDITDIEYKRNPELMNKTFSEDALRPLWRAELKKHCSKTNFIENN